MLHFKSRKTIFFLFVLYFFVKCTPTVLEFFKKKKNVYTNVQPTNNSLQKLMYTIFKCSQQRKAKKEMLNQGQCVDLEKNMETFSYLFIKCGGNICQAAAVCKQTKVELTGSYREKQKIQSSWRRWKKAYIEVCDSKRKNTEITAKPCVTLLFLQTIVRHWNEVLLNTDFSLLFCTTKNHLENNWLKLIKKNWFWENLHKH